MGGRWRREAIVALRAVSVLGSGCDEWVVGLVVVGSVGEEESGFEMVVSFWVAEERRARWRVVGMVGGLLFSRGKGRWMG